MEMYVNYAQLFYYSDLSGNIEKYFELGLQIFVMGFYFDYEGLLWVFKIFRVGFLKQVEIN